MESNQEYMLIAGYNRVTTLHIKFVMGYQRVLAGFINKTC